MIKTEEQWMKEGCDNCESLDIKNDVDRMINCTSARFEGMISLIYPSQSWVAKWNRIEHKVPGCYAFDVQGVLPEDIPEEDEDKT